jgi:perosamine synthetase
LVAGRFARFQIEAPPVSQLAVFGGAPAVSRPLQPFNGVGRAERDAAVRVIEQGTLSGFYGSPQPRFFGGPEVTAFEAEWRDRFAVAHAVSVNSATSGLIAAMGAVGVSPGDEVIVPPYTMSATAVAPLFYGGVPVFADIDPVTFCIDPDAVERAITPRTRAIIAVNLFGHPAELARLRALADRHGLFLVEDNAQGALAHENGRLTGGVGHIGVFSLNVHKHIQTGEGGVCVTDDDDLARRLQLIRNHGENAVEWQGMTDLTNLVGQNYRLPEIAAAMARAQLGKLDGLVARCERIAARLSAGLADLPGLTPPATRPNCRHVYFMWTARYDADRVGAPRAAFARALNAEGVPVAEGYVAPLYWLPLFRERRAIGRDGFPFTLTDRTYPRGLCPVVEDMHCNRVIQFQPVSWDADDEQVDMMIDAFRKVHRAATSLATA